jgi:hypothetical protein
MKNPKIQLLSLLLLTALVRLPFIFDGYGVEEDSWGLVVNAYEMKATGHYVASRFPGHPLQEYLYLGIYDAPAWAYNLFSLLASVAATGFFFLALRIMKLNSAWFTALAFSFVPVFYISGTYTIDFALTMAFLMASFYFLLDRKLLLSGIMIGMATGCRITSEVFLLPWAILLWNRQDPKEWFRQCLLLAVPALVVGIAWFIPAYQQYGRAFFDYSDQFPYPPMAKVMYKATLGVFGFIGIAAMAWYSIPAIRIWRKKLLQGITLFSPERLLLVCLLIIVLHIISYLRLPQKSGYMMPVVPFTVLLFALLLPEKKMRGFAFLFVLSPFLMSINLTDSLRGSESTSLAVKFRVSGQEIFIDPLSGPILSERSKRLNKMKYCEEVLQKAKSFDYRYRVISGWWYNELQTAFLQKGKQLSPHFSFYEECSKLDSARAAGTEIYYLPEQDLYNDQMFGQACTDSIAKPFPSN